MFWNEGAPNVPRWVLLNCFSTPLGTGHGVVTLLNDVIRGGDSMIYYFGNYQMEGEAFTAQVSTDAHSQPPGMSSVFGRNKVHINLAGSFVGEDALLTGTATELPAVKFSAKLRKIGS